MEARRHGGTESYKSYCSGIHADRTGIQNQNLFTVKNTTEHKLGIEPLLQFIREHPR